MSHVEVSGSLEKILQGAATHKYLGGLIVGNLKKKSETEPAHRFADRLGEISQKQTRPDQPSCFLKIAAEIF